MSGFSVEINNIMKKYIRARAAKLLEEINNVPIIDTCDDIKLKLILAAIREVNIEMFHNVAERSRDGIATIKAEAHMADVDAVNEKREAKIKAEEDKAGFDSKPAPKIVLSSSCIRRVDND